MKIGDYGGNSIEYFQKDYVNTKSCNKSSLGGHVGSLTYRLNMLYIFAIVYFI